MELEEGREPMELDDDELLMEETLHITTHILPRWQSLRRFGSSGVLGRRNVGSRRLRPSCSTVMINKARQEVQVTERTHRCSRQNNEDLRRLVLSYKQKDVRVVVPSSKTTTYSARENMMN